MGDLGHNGSANALVPARRRELIADRLREKGSVSVAELESEFGVSSMTARRDLHALERDGVARRTHGGAVVPSVSRDEDSFASRLEQAEESKQRLAVAACDQVADGEAVFVDSSTTAYFAVRELLQAGRRATLLTNSVPVMDLVARSDSQVGLIGLSGSLRRLTCSFVGPQAVAATRGHFADKLLFSVTGVTSDDVLTDADPLEAEIKRAMLEHARCAVLLADGSKFGRSALSAIAPLSDVGTVILADASRTTVRTITRAGADLVEV
jgi:DeoR/GlpR family transcriptional regulator of sugar metabolism